MEKKLYKKGDIICKEGEEGNEMYVILSGSVVPHKTVNGQKVELSPVLKDNFFGEMALFSKTTRSATVIAAEPTEVLILTKETLLQRIQMTPGFGVKIIEKLVRRLEDAHDKIAELAGIKTSLEMMYGKKQ